MDFIIDLPPFSYYDSIMMQNSFVLLMMQNSFVLSMWVHGASLVDVQKTCCDTKQLAHSTPKGI
jgi:hypothetical protein